MRTGTGPIDACNAIEWGHPDNAGLACLLASPVGTGGGAGSVYKDLTGKTAGATLAGGAAWVGTPYGQSGLRLSGSGQWADAQPAAPTFLGDFAIFATINPTQVGSGVYRVVAGRGAAGGGTNEAKLYVGDTGRLLLTRGGGLIAANTVLTLNRWHRVGISVISGAATFYLNGQPDGTAATSTTATASGTPFRVGADPAGGTSAPDQYFAGVVAGVAAYAGGVSAGWVARDYAWSQDPSRDPRLRRTSARSYFLPAIVTPATATAGGRRRLASPPGPIDTANAIEWGHPDNVGLACLLVSPNGTGGGAGQVWKDLTGKTAGTTLAGEAAWVETPYGQQGLLLNGATGYCNTGLRYSGSANSVTVAVWVRSDVAGNDAHVMNINYDGSTVPLDLNVGAASGTTGNGFGFYDGGWQKSGMTTDVRGDKRWHRVAGTYDGTTLAYYIDGRLDASSVYTGTIPTGNANTLDLGRYAANPTAYFAGAMAGALVMFRAASPAWIARDYEWSQDPTRDPRLRRTSTRSLFVTTAGVPSYSFVPAFAPGWGW